MYFLKRWSRKDNSPKEGKSPNRSIRAIIYSKDLIFSLILLFLNFLFLWPFLAQPYPQASFSAPILPLLSKVVDFLTPLNFVQATGTLVILSFPFASVSWYIFFKKISGDSITSFLAGLIFLLPWFYLPRFTIFWQMGDGVHALGFAFLPLVGILLSRFLRTGSFNLFLASFMGVSFVSLISPFALLNLYLFFAILTFSEMLLGQARIKILRFFMVCLFAQGLSSFWYHPNFLLALLRSDQGRIALSSFWKLFPISFFTVPILGAFSFLIFDRKPNLQPLFFTATLTSLYLALTAAESFGEYLPFPVPVRFLPEFYIGLSFILAILISAIIKLHPQKLTFLRIYPSLHFAHHLRGTLLTTFFTALLAWPLFSLFSGEPILSSATSPQVLGVENGWWEIPRTGIGQWGGLGITFLTVVTGFFLKKKTKS